MIDSKSRDLILYSEIHRYSQKLKTLEDRVRLLESLISDYEDRLCALEKNVRSRKRYSVPSRPSPPMGFGPPSPRLFRQYQ